MEAYEQLVSTLALVLGVGWASGINLYAAVAVLGFAGATGNLELPAELETLQDPLVIGVACLMYVVEFFADKIPGVDSAWDTLHTFIRIPAGAMLAAGTVGDVTPALEIGAGLLGGSMAMGSHFTKASTRLLINTSPEPFSNWGTSIGEDMLVFGGLWAMFNHPWVFLGLMLVFIVLVIWLLPKLWRLVRAVFRRIGTWLGLVKKQPDDAEGVEDGLMPDAPLAPSTDKPTAQVGVGSPFKDR